MKGKPAVASTKKHGCKTSTSQFMPKPHSEYGQVIWVEFCNTANQNVVQVLKFKRKVHSGMKQTHLKERHPSISLKMQ